jgi:hypothetical protein
MEMKLFKASPLILEKINVLCRLLWQGKRSYESVADNISGKEFRCAILALAQTNNQYARELSSRIETLGGDPCTENMYDTDLKTDPKIFMNENEVLSFCKLNETKMVGAYREILNESFLYEGLRTMIRYQLNGTLCAYAQIKLLKSFSKIPGEQFIL